MSSFLTLSSTIASADKHNNIKAIPFSNEAAFVWSGFNFSNKPSVKVKIEIFIFFHMTNGYSVYNYTRPPPQGDGNTKAFRN